MTKVERTCPRCGLVFASEKLDDLCPGCLLTNTLDMTGGDDLSAFWEDEPASTALGRSFSHFEIMEELGRGGMGTVYKARDHTTERIVALKVLQAHHLSEPDLVQRFRAEVRAISSLDHRHILPIHEVGENDGIPFFSMKLATGGSLANRLGDYLGRPRPAAQLLAKVARGVQHAHERGILHRDLKPGNILLDNAGEPYVCDFGLAKWLEEDRRLTITSAVLGTPHYIAPEQAAGKQGLTIAADIYSLGAILYELLTGRPPFVGETVIDTLRQASENTPAKPSSIVNQTPRDLETICLKALEREPGARYHTATAFADDLDNWLAGRPIRARPVTAAEQLWRWARRNPLPAILGATLVLALVILAVGATVAAVNINQSRTRAVAAEQDAREQLYTSLLAQARAARVSGQAGHRINALKAIKQAAAIRSSMELRNEAIAALTLVDIDGTKTFKVRENSRVPLACDAAVEYVYVVTNENDIAVVSLADGQQRRVISGVGKPIVALIHSGARYLALRSSDDAVYILESATGRHLGYYPGYKLLPVRNYASPSDCTFSQDETLLALTSPEGLHIIDILSGRVIARHETIPPNYTSFDTTGRRLVFGNYKESSVHVWSFLDQTRSENSIRALSLPAEPSCFGWSDDGRTLAVGCTDSAIRLFSTTDWSNFHVLLGHRHTVMKTSFSRGGDMLFSTSADGTARIWDLKTQSQLVELPRYVAESSAGFSFDNTQIAIVVGQSVTVLKIIGLQRLCKAFSPPSNKEQTVVGNSLDFSEDSRLLAWASTTCVQVIDTQNGRLLWRLPITTPTQTTVKFLPDAKRLAVLSRNTGLSLHEFSFQNSIFLVANTEVPSSMRWRNYVFGTLNRNRSNSVCLTSDKEARGMVWDLSAGKVLCETTGNPTILDMAVSPDQKWLVTTDRSASAKVLQFPSGKVFTELSGGRYGTVTFSPSGRWVGITGDTKHILWRVGTWQAGPDFPSGLQEKVGSFAFSSDEKYLAARSGDQIALITFPEMKFFALMDQHLQPIPFGRLRFSHDGGYLASQGLDNSLIIWDLNSLYNELRALNLHW